MNPCSCPRPWLLWRADKHAWMRPALFPDWSCQFLAWARAQPCRRPSWLCAPPPHHAHACCIPHDWILQDPETVLSCKVNVSARMSHWLTCNAGISLCTGHPKKKKRICKIRIWMSNQTFVRAVKTDRSYIIVFSSLVSQSYFHYFLNLPFFFFLQVTPSEGAPFKDVRWKENILCTTLSAVTFALSFDSPLPLSQPSSPDKKEPLLRCFARHYKTVAMDTQSEQAPHTGSRIGNDRCNILHL